MSIDISKVSYVSHQGRRTQDFTKTKSIQFKATSPGEVCRPSVENLKANFLTFKGSLEDDLRFYQGRKIDFDFLDIVKEVEDTLKTAIVIANENDDRRVSTVHFLLASVNKSIKALEEGNKDTGFLRFLHKRAPELFKNNSILKEKLKAFSETIQNEYNLHKTDVDINSQSYRVFEDKYGEPELHVVLNRAWLKVVHSKELWMPTERPKSKEENILTVIASSEFPMAHKLLNDFLFSTDGVRNHKQQQLLKSAIGKLKEAQKLKSNPEIQEAIEILGKQVKGKS